MIAGVAATKMHGARNDFVVIDVREYSLHDEAAFARRVCDRHSGIGADGVLLVGASTQADASMRVINADGSEAEMCGNGIRCVARYLDERGEGAARRIETLAGVLDTVVLSRGAVYQVRVSMGRPSLVDQHVAPYDGTLVDTGNRHVVLFREALDRIDLRSLGEEFQSMQAFPNGTNVHVAQMQARHEMRVRHYERGAGLTMACGTGAVASVVAARARGIADERVLVHVPGGSLEIELDADGHAFMTGPAVSVFSTTIDAGRIGSV